MPEKIIDSLPKCFTKDVLLDRIEHAYLFYCFDLVVNSSFLISNPHKYHIEFKRDRTL